MNLYLDIETLPSADESLVEVSHPATMSKPETIAAWELEKKPQAIKDALAKTSFDGLYGSVCVIAWAFDDESVTAVSGDEKEVLSASRATPIPRHLGLRQLSSVSPLSFDEAPRFPSLTPRIDKTQFPTLVRWYA